MLEERTNLRSKDIKGTETCGKGPASMNQTHQVIGTCAAHISWNLGSRDSEVELAGCEIKCGNDRQRQVTVTQHITHSWSRLFTKIMNFLRPRAKSNNQGLFYSHSSSLKVLLD